MTEILKGVIEAGSSLLVGLITLLGVILQNAKYGREIEHKLKTAQAVTDTKLEELTREVREHNDLVKRLPVVENDIATIYKRLDSSEKHLAN